MRQWSVREASHRDVARLALVGGATFLETFAGILDGAAIVEHCQREHCAEAYDSYLAAGASAWLAETEVGSAPIGFALLAKPDLAVAEPEKDLELKRIYALSRYHGTGVGPALMQRAVARATETEASRLLLGVYAGNARALAFYARSGFEPVAERRFRVGGKEYDDIVLAKQLA